jgi:hypothetical protein
MRRPKRAVGPDVEGAEIEFINPKLRSTVMKIRLVATRAMAVLAVTSAFMSQNAAQAQGALVRKSISFVTMVCHESGGSGAPLTDYVNNVDVSLMNQLGEVHTALPGDIPTIYTETTPGPSGLPTSCAVAASYLSELGLTLTQSFSHFPGYYIEIFTT